MPAINNVRPHATLIHDIDELSLDVVSTKAGELELDIFAYGEADVAYDRDGDWEIIGLRIYGRRHRDSAGHLKTLVDLPKGHAFYPLIVAALHSVSWQDIGDRVGDALANERRVA